MLAYWVDGSANRGQRRCISLFLCSQICADIFVSHKKVLDFPRLSGAGVLEVREDAGRLLRVSVEVVQFCYFHGWRVGCGFGAYKDCQIFRF